MSYVPHKNEKGERRYGVCSYRKGNLEDLTRCVMSVSDSKGWHSYQCKFKRGHGPDNKFCKRHAKMVKA